MIDKIITPDPHLTNSAEYQAYIFDLDGTLLDTLENLASCYNRALSLHGYPTHEVDAYRYFIGDGAVKCVERCLPVHARTTCIIEKLLETQRADYQQNWKENTAPYPEILELLAKLKSKNARMAVLSNKDQMFTEACVNYFFPAETFDQIVGFSAATPHKPNPAGAKKIATTWDLPPTQIAFLGDTSMDIETANKSGMTSVGVLWGFRPLAELQDAGAKHIVESPHEILDLKP